MPTLQATTALAALVLAVTTTSTRAQDQPPAGASEPGAVILIEERPAGMTQTQEPGMTATIMKVGPEVLESSLDEPGSQPEPVIVTDAVISVGIVGPDGAVTITEGGPGTFRQLPESVRERLHEHFQTVELADQLPPEFTEGVHADLRARFQEMADRARAQRNARERKALGMTEEDYDAAGPLIEAIRALLREKEAAMALLKQATPDSAEAGHASTATRVAWGAEPMSDEGEDLHRAARKLADALDDDKASARKLKRRMGDLREALDDLDGRIAGKRDALRELITPRQEAILVLRGVLD